MTASNTLKQHPVGLLDSPAWMGYTYHPVYKGPFDPFGADPFAAFLNTPPHDPTSSASAPSSVPSGAGVSGSSVGMNGVDDPAKTASRFARLFPQGSSTNLGGGPVASEPGNGFYSSPVGENEMLMGADLGKKRVSAGNMGSGNGLENSMDGFGMRGPQQPQLPLQPQQQLAGLTAVSLFVQYRFSDNIFFLF
jgi:hypothetical protein